MYRVVKVIEIIERVKNTVAATRWASIKKQAGDIAIPGHRGTICVNEEGLEKVLSVTHKGMRAEDGCAEYERSRYRRDEGQRDCTTRRRH
jgi:hypothetical protein